jgi:hypothetical protein
MSKWATGLVNDFDRDGKAFKLVCQRSANSDAIHRMSSRHIVQH